MERFLSSPEHQVDECEVVGELGRPRHVPGEAEHTVGRAAACSGRRHGRGGKHAIEAPKAVLVWRRGSRAGCALAIAARDTVAP
jgi:hypothetical protein